MTFTLVMSQWDEEDLWTALSDGSDSCMDFQDLSEVKYGKLT